MTIGLKCRPTGAPSMPRSLSLLPSHRNLRESRSRSPMSRTSSSSLCRRDRARDRPETFEKVENEMAVTHWRDNYSPEELVFIDQYRKNRDAAALDEDELEERSREVCEDANAIHDEAKAGRFFPRNRYAKLDAGKLSEDEESALGAVLGGHATSLDHSALEEAARRLGVQLTEVSA